MNIEDLQIVHSPEGGRGTVHLTVAAAAAERRDGGARSGAGLDPDPAGVRIDAGPRDAGWRPPWRGERPRARRQVDRPPMAPAGGARPSVGVELEGVPRSLDTASTATCLAILAPAARPALEAWGSSPAGIGERQGSTWNREASTLDLEVLDLHGEGRGSLRRPARDLDCGNSGTSMRLLAGLVASAPFVTVLRGDASLSTRPMERVATPLRAMGAEVATEDGHPPVTIRGADARGIRFAPEVPSAQVKGAVLLAGLAARGHDDRRRARPDPRSHGAGARRARGADRGDRRRRGPRRAVPARGFRGRVPGDPSSAAFVLGAAALTEGEVTITGVGLNPSRLGFMDVLAEDGRGSGDRNRRAGAGRAGRDDAAAREPGRSGRCASAADEMPLVIDEVPLLAALAVHAEGPSRFEGGAELRVKESDRLSALVEGIRALGGSAEADGRRSRGRRRRARRRVRALARETIGSRWR